MFVTNGKDNFPTSTQISVIPDSDDVIGDDVVIEQYLRFGIPVRLTIQKIHVDASIESLGITNDGFMDVTKWPYDVAWFNLWPRPWEIGSAVIAGHYGIWESGAESVFNKLDTLVKGDIISVEDDTGRTISFIVRESKIYKWDADAFDVFASNDGKSHLNLITCVQDQFTRKFPDRLVIFADKEIFTDSQ